MFTALYDRWQALPISNNPLAVKAKGTATNIKGKYEIILFAFICTNNLGFTFVFQVIGVSCGLNNNKNFFASF